MRTSLRIACLLFASGAAQLSANTGSGTLNLVTNQTGINKLTITVGASASGLTASDAETTTMTGSINASFNADPVTGATTAMTITGGDIAMTNMHFVLKALIFIPVADITTANMRGTAYTPPPIPSVVTATATGGNFDGTLHRVLINQGTMTGAITANDPDTPINSDFVSSPVEGAGTGTGTVTMVPGTFDATRRTMLATVQIPVDFTDSQDMGGTPVTIRVQGTIKASGSVIIPMNPLAVPGFNPASGIYPAGQGITITGESGSTIFYRVNGGPEQSAASPVTGLTVPAAPGTLAISAYAKKPGLADSATITANYTGSFYKTWANTYFPGVTDPAIVGLEADPDRDGQVNFLEFALGGEPNNAAANAIIHSRIAASDAPENAGEFLLTIAVRTNTPVFTGSPASSASMDGFNYSVQGSEDLADFTSGVVALAPVTAGLPPAPVGYEYRTFRLDGPNHVPVPGGFLRVRVTAGP